MKTKIAPLFCLIIFILFGCGKTPGGGDFFSSVQLHYVDQYGKDLFTNGQNGYILDSIKVYDYGNGVKNLIYNQGKDYPNGYTPNPLYPGSGISFGPANNNIINQYTVSIIRLKPGVEDTIRIHLNKSSQMGAIYDQVMYNGVLINKDYATIVKKQ